MTRDSVALAAPRPAGRVSGRWHRGRWHRLRLIVCARTEAQSVSESPGRAGPGQFDGPGRDRPEQLFPGRHRADAGARRP